MELAVCVGVITGLLGAILSYIQICFMSFVSTGRCVDNLQWKYNDEFIDFFMKVPEDHQMNNTAN